LPDSKTDPGPARAEIERHALRSGLLQLFSQVVRVALFIGSGVVLARLLTPADFGLMAMVTTLTVFVESFREFGLPMAVTQRDDFDQEQFNVLFRVLLLLNAGTALFMVAAGPAIARLYHEPRLVAITLVTAAGYLVLGLGTLHQALLIREMRFKRLAAVELGSQVAGITIGIGAALLGAGYWALVGLLLTTNASKGAALWIASGWRPALTGHPPQSDPRVGSILRQGAHIAGFEMVNYFGRNTDNVVVGYVGGATALGLYDSAWRWSLYPLLQVYTPLLGVAVSSLSRVHRDPAAYRRACRVGLLPIFSLVTPALTFLFVNADAVIVAVFGNQWRATVPIFRVLVVAAFATSIMKVLSWLYLSEGRAQDQFRWGLIYTPAMVVAVIAAAGGGAHGVAIAVAVGNWALVAPAAWMCLRRSPLRATDLFSVVARPGAASAAAAVLLLAFLPAQARGSIQVSHLALQATAFAIVYALTWVVIPGGRGQAGRIMRMVRAARAQRPS
jgi:O-antigen/teichoic acid export membrane protein